MKPYTLRGKLVKPATLIPRGQVEVTAGKITYSGPLRPPSGEVVDYGGAMIAPGFIDIHIHGAARHDVMDPNTAALPAISRHLAAGGVTGFLATVQTAPLNEMKQALTRIAKATRSDLPGAALLGSHVEGPFLSPQKKGAQDPEHLIHATTDDTEELHRASRGSMKVMTLAPEEPGGLEAVDWLTEHGVVASAGHSNATLAEAKAAFSHGVTHLSHFYNGMRGFHHREPGIVGAGLTDSRVSLELVADLHHVNPTALRLAVQAKGPGMVALVSDSVKPAGLPDGKYTYRGRRLHVRGGVAALSDGTIAGSVIRLSDAVGNMVNHVGVSVPDAVQMASRTPARILGLGKGALISGMDADITVLDSDFKPLRTIIEGVTVYEADQRE